MSVELRQFKDSEVILTQEQAWKILRFFWPETSTEPGGLTQSDVVFAQGLLVEAIDSSYKLGFVDHIFGSFYMKVPTSFADIKDMVKEFAKAALKHWFRHATGEDLKNPRIYESVRVTLARNFRSAWRLRQATGQLTY